MAAPVSGRSFLSTRRGVYTLLLLCTVQFMDIIDSSIMNVALPSIRSELGFSQQGTLIAAAGMYYLSRIPVHGSYPTDLLPGLAIMSIGLGAVFVTVTTAANAGVPDHQAGLAAGLLNTSLQLGSALGLAVFSAIATALTNDLLTGPTEPAQALTAGFAQALLAGSIALLAATVIALRATNTRGHTPPPGSQPAPDIAGPPIRVPAE